MNHLKYAFIIPAGAADAPVDDLDGLTPLEAADMPNLSALTREGRVGSVDTLAPGGPPRCADAIVTLLGLNVRLHAFGSAGLIAHSFGIALAPDDWAFALSFVTVDPETSHLIHHRAGGVEPSEARLLLESLSSALADEFGDRALGLEFIPGEGDDHLLIDRAHRHDYSDIETMAPAETLNEPIARTLPRAPAAARGPTRSAVDFLQTIVHTSATVFAGHEVNETRRSIGEMPISQVVLHGKSRHVEFASFASRFRGLKAGIVTTDDVAAGAALAVGFDRIEIHEDLGPGLPWGDDLGAVPTHEDLAFAAIRAIERDVHDVICVYVESPREASYESDFAGKIASLESIDRDIILPIHRALLAQVGAARSRIIVVPDQAALTMRQRPDSRPVPFVINGADMVSVRHFDALTEKHGNESDLHITPGHNFMEYALFSGLLAKW